MRALKKSIIALLFLLVLSTLCPQSEAAYDDYTAISPVIPVNAVGSFTLYADETLTTVLGTTATTQPGSLRFDAISFDEPGDYVFYLKAVDDLGSESVFRILFHVTVDAGDELAAQVFVYQAGSTEKTGIMNYHISLLKIDSESENGAVKPLEGAVFDLYRGSDVRNGKPIVTNGVAAEPLKKDMRSDSEGNISLGNLQPGIYYLRETKAPTGYGRRNAMMKLSVGSEGVKLDEAEAVAIDDQGQAIPTAVPIGHRIYRITVENTKGTLMPSSGGAGTWMFYVTGALILAAAAVILLKKTR